MAFPATNPTPCVSRRAAATPAIRRKSRGPWNRHHRQQGFTLVDTGLFLLCLGLATYIAFAETGKLRHRLKRDTLIDDVRQIAAVFESHRAQKGEWPPATTPEIRVPRGLEPALAKTRWAAGPPFGGSYDWIPPARSLPEGAESADRSPASGLLAITAFSPSRPLTLSRADLLYLDRKLDDGDLATGRFRTGFNGWPVYQIPAGR